MTRLLSSRNTRAHGFLTRRLPGLPHLTSASLTVYNEEVECRSLSGEQVGLDALDMTPIL